MPAQRTLLETLVRRARERPGPGAFHFQGATTSYGELWSAAGRVACALRKRNLEPGDRVVLAAPNGADFFTAFYGIQRAGGVPVPLFPGSGPSRLGAMARRCGSRLCVLAPEAAAGDGAGELEATLSTEGVRSVTLPAAAAAECGDDPDLPLPKADDLAYLQYTSGSTGEPKGVEIRHGALLENIRQMIAGMEITNDDVFVSWLPVHHDMGLVLMTMVPLFLGLPLFLLPTSLRNPGLWLSEIARRRATFTAAPDFAYRLCLRRIDHPENYDLTSLRVALNASEPVRRRTLEEFESRFGLPRVMSPAYGLAEATVGVSMCRPGHPVKLDRRGCVSVGRPFPDVEIAILAADRLAAPGEVGEILVRSPANTRGYWNDPEATASLFWRDGYVRTGDVGYLDEDGDLFVVGRQKNLIIQAGRNLAPREVEEAIDPLPFVRASAAVGIDRGGDEGEQVYAFVELHRKYEGASADHAGMAIRVVAAVNAHLGLRPGRVYLMPAGSVPRTTNGKIRYEELRQSYLDGSARAGGRLLFPGY